MILVGQILFTKDGRKTGNAIVTGKEFIDGFGEVYFCRTDFGNTLRLTTAELVRNFYQLKNGEAFMYNPLEQLKEQREKLSEFSVNN
jgi:hypothetical protein